MPRPGDGAALVVPAGTVAATSVRRAEAEGRGRGRRAGDGARLAPPGAVLDAGAGTPASSPGPEACGRCDPPAVMATVIPAVMASAAATATAATTPGCRRTRAATSDGPDGPIALGKPAGPNAPARCATLIRCARPAGELSAQAVSTWPASPAGGGASGGSSALIRRRGDRRVQDPSRRRHSFRATACSQGPNRSGSRSPSSLAVAIRKVSSTASAASAPAAPRGSRRRGTRRTGRTPRRSHPRHLRRRPRPRHGPACA